MIRTMRIRNLALIEDVSVDFEAGFNVFTGETGAGKTIIVSGLDLLTGARADAEKIRAGEERLEVEGLFSCPGNPQVARVLEEQGLADPDETDQVFVRRVISRDGRNRCWVNGKMCGVSTLAALGEYLVDIHGQHEHQRLLSPRNHLEYLDRFGGEEHLRRLEEYRGAYREWRGLRRQAEEARMDEAERLQQVDFLRFQIREIEEAAPREGELEELSERRRLMQNYESLFSLTREALGALEDEEGTGSSDTLARSLASLGKAESIDPRLAKLREELEEAKMRVEEAARELKGYLEELHFDPAQLEEVGQRIFCLKALYKKYGSSYGEVEAFSEKAAARMEELEDYHSRLESIQQRMGEKEGEVAVLAGELSRNRSALAAGLEREAMAELGELGMEGVTFSVSMVEAKGFGEAGSEQVEFTISPGRNEPSRPIARIASGGELARLMLALKIVLARADEVDALVFDEVDAGIGGVTAAKIGVKMSVLAGYHQVITVTHLPQIAAYAVSQHRISKVGKGERQVTRIECLAGVERQEEIARMLGGASQTALRHAGELLREAGE